MELYIRLEKPFEWVRVDGRKVEAFGEVAALAEYPINDEYELVGVVSGEWVTAHRVELPAKSRKQFQAALPYALEETLSEDIEQLIFNCPEWRPGAPCVVYVTSRLKMQEWQSLANEAALPVSRLIPDYALLPLHEAADCMLVQQADRFLSFDKTNFGVSLDLDFLDSWVREMPMDCTIAVSDKALTEELIDSHADRDFRHWPIGNKMAHWMEQTSVRDLDIWSDSYRPAVSTLAWRSFSLPAGIAAAAVLLVLLFDTYRYFSLHQEVRSIDQAMQKLVLETFPEIDAVQRDNELAIMQQALARRGGPQQELGINHLLAEISRVLRQQNVSLTELVYRDGQLVINCSLNDFSQVDEIRRQLNARPRISANLEASSSNDGQITASYVVSHS
ncbi:MAG: hypothetical protein HKN50_03510 [Gammaproteobacteria bacterium]|nr:hypothetical protein [Gammaproteobacteria bacterium]